MSADGGGAIAWSDLAAGPACPASLTALADADPADLTGAQLVDAIVCSEKAASLVLGVQARLMARMAVPFVAGDPMRLAGKLARRSGLTGGDDYQANVQAMVPEAAVSLAAGEIGAALRIAPVTAGMRVRQAVQLTEEFTLAREALEAGVIDRGKLRALVDQVQVLPAEQVGPVLEQVLPEVADRCTSEIREIAAQAVITANPDSAAERHRQAAARREVKVTPGTDAMATLKAFLPADGAVKIFQVSDLMATGTAGIPGDLRGIGARRADALIDLADRLLTDGCIDLTGYLGQPLPDHGHPTPRHSDDHPCTTHPQPTDPAVDPRLDTDTPVDPAIPVATDTTHTDRTRPGPADPADPATGSGLSPAADHRADTDTPVDPAIPVATDTTHPDPTQPGPADPAVPGPIDPAGTAPDVPAPSAPAGPVAGASGAGRVMSRQGRRPHLTVTMSLDTLAGLNDLPGLLAGFGTIPADLARSIAASAGTIAAAITDPATGAVTTSGELTYRPRQALRDKVGVLTDTCQFPSCRQPVWRCDLDHRDPFNHRHPGRGGRTCEANMHSLCRRHHLLKDHANWQVSVDTSSLVINWTSPTGHIYPRRARQTAPPEAWIRTSGTTIADELDRIATNAQDPTGATSPFEDRLTDAVLRHALANPSRVELDPETDGRPINPAADQDHDDDLDDDPPPF